MTREHENLRSHVNAAVEIDHVSVEHADAAARYFVPDRFRHVGAVNTIDRAAEVYGAGTQRIAFAARHPAREIWLARDHLLRRRPIRPFGFSRNKLGACPGKAVTPDTDAVADRSAI